MGYAVMPPAVNSISYHDVVKCARLHRLIGYSIITFVFLCSLRTFYFSPRGPGYREPLLPPTRIPIAKAPASLAASLFRFGITPRLDLQGTRLLLLIISAPAEHHRRRRIRHSWGHRGRLKSIGAAAVFVIGASSDPKIHRSYKQEADEFGDILYDEKLTDSYGNLTRKVLSALYWVSSQQWKQLDFVAKIDSDNFVTLATLQSTTKLLNPNKPEIIGKVYKGEQPYRKKNHKWFMSKKQYPLAVYPNYCRGQGYMMTIPTLLRIVCLEALQDIQKGRVWRFEDVFITGVLRQRLGIELKDKFWISEDENRPEFIT